MFFHDQGAFCDGRAASNANPSVNWSPVKKPIQADLS